MPLRYLTYAQLDLAAWDACVAAATEPVVYACSWWLAATAGRWDAVVEVDEASGAYLSVLPLPIKRRPWGREVYQPPFTQQLGLLLTEGSVCRHLPDYLAALPAETYQKLYYQLHTAQPPFQLPDDMHQQVRWNYLLNVDSPYSFVRAGYSPSTRRRVRQNEHAAAPLRVTSTDDAEPLLALFQQTKSQEAGLNARHFRILRHLIHNLRQQQVLDICEVRHPTTRSLLAGALFVRYRSRVVYLFAAASQEGKAAAAPTILLNAVVQRYSGTPGLVLDFEGGMIPSIAQFFANFGAAAVPYAALSQTRNPWYLSWMR